MKKKLRVFCSLLLAVQMILSMVAVPVFADDEVVTPEEYKQLESPSAVYNMNVDWKFKKSASGSEYPLAKATASVTDANGKQFYEVGYDDSTWETVSVPHPINGEDSFDGQAFDAGESSLYRGFMFYRKNIEIPASDEGKKLFLEFEAFRQSVYVYVNGQIVGFYEAGVAPVGFDITDYVKYGEANLIAVATDNCSDRGQADRSKITAETRYGSVPGAADGYGYQWNTKDFNEVQGGITGNVNLYAKGSIYQTLPLYNNLKTTGNYIYGSDYDIDDKTATINVEAEVRNETSEDVELTLQVDVVDMETGALAYTFEQTGTAEAATDPKARFISMVPIDAYAHETTDVDGNPNQPAPTDTSTVDVSYIKASFDATDMKFWSDKTPYLYTVYTYLKDGSGEIIDAQKTVTGFRKVEYDINDGGLKINDVSTYLKGYAQRSTNEWAVVGVANDWLSDIDMMLLKESNGNHIRWMHIAPNPVDIRAGDKYGVISTVPAGDKEGDVADRAWDQRVEAMRDVMIYFRNNPSVFFWEAGNANISAAHMQEMTDLKAVLDPKGGRFAGSRTISGVDQIQAAEYVGTMLNRNASSAKNSMATAGKYMPITETEYARDEAPRRVWDDFSPPDFDYVNRFSGGTKKDGLDVWDQTSEDFAVYNAKAYEEFYAGRVGGGGSELYAGAAIMVWSDSNMHTRNTFSENCRTSGKVDAIRIKKEAFYSLQAVQSDEPKIHIVGHWNYPQLTEDNYWYSEKVWDDVLGYWVETGTRLQRDPHKKTVYVIGSPDVKKVEIYINGTLAGTDMKPDNTFVYAFPEIDVTQSGEISAKAYDDRGIVIAEDNIKTAGEAATIKLTPVTGPSGLIADGSDIAYFDVEVVDAEGNVCPLNYDRIDLSVSGEGVLLGGYNSGVGDKITTGKDYVFAECGVNRVFVRSTRNVGNVTLTASMDGLGSVSSTIPTKEFVNSVGDATGLSLQMQEAYGQNPIIEEIVMPVEPYKSLASAVKADFSEGGNTKIAEVIDTTEYFTVTVNGTEVTFAESAYRPIGSEIVSEVVPVLDALKAAGANITYTYLKDGEKPSYVTAGDLPVVSITGGLKNVTVGENNSQLTQIDLANGYTTVILNQGEDDNLMDAVAEVTKAGELKAELKVMLGYLDGVTFARNDETKTYEITYTAPAAATLSSASLESKSAPKAVLLDDTAPVTTMSVSNGTVTIKAADSMYDAQLIFALYNDDGSLAKIDAGTTVSASADDVKTVNVPAEILTSSNTYKVMLWDSLQGMKPICDTVDIVSYEIVQYNENFNSNTQTDGPDGTGYLQSTVTDTLAYDGMGTVWASEARMEMDFRFDDAAATMRMSNGKNKTGPFFSFDGTNFRTQTGQTSYQTLGAIEVGSWYNMVIEGKMSVAGCYADFKLYKWENGQKTLVNTVNGMNLRNFGSTSNGYSEKLLLSAGVSVDNVKFTSLYANEVAVSATTEEINANETVMATAVATRDGRSVTIPTFAWSLYDENGKPLADETVTINESGMLITTAETASQIVTVRATAQTKGNPYGEIKIKINAIDTSNDTFDAITLSSDKDYVRLNENTTITPTTTKNGEAVDVADEDIVWSVYNAANVREVKNIGVKVENGVVSVNEDVLPQTLTIRASNASGSATASVQLTVKPGNMILDGELGNFDTYVSGNVCEDLITGVALEEGSWDGTGYYKLTGAREFTGFSGDNSDHVLYSADMRFDAENAGWVVWNNSKGKQGMQVKYTGGNLGIVQDGSRTPTYLAVDQTSWYNVQIMCSTGNDKAYAHLIVYKYVDGKRVHPTTGEEGVAFVQQGIPMRNLSTSTANHLEIQGGTSVDNVYCVKTTPDALTASVDKDTMFAGQNIQASVTATRKGVPFGYISSDLVKWVIYDADNKNPLDTDMMTIDASGKFTVDSLADSQSVYLRVSTIDGLLYDSVKVDITSSDIFTVNTIGFKDEEYKNIATLELTKNFYYNDEVTFVAAVYDSTETTLKSVATKKLSGKDIVMGDTTVSLGIDLPADFDKDSDVLYIYTVTSISENPSITKVEDAISGAFDGNNITITTKPTFDESSKVIVMVLKPGADAASVKDTDIAYIKQVVGSDIANIASIALAEAASGEYTVVMAGKINGSATLNTGVVTK